MVHNSCLYASHPSSGGKGKSLALPRRRPGLGSRRSGSEYADGVPRVLVVLSRLYRDERNATDQASLEHCDCRVWDGGRHGAVDNS